MLARYALPLFLALSSLLAHGQEAAIARAERLGSALGLAETLEELRTSSVDSTKSQLQSLINELRKAGIPEASAVRLATLAAEMCERVARSWDAKEASRIYAENLADGLSEQELAEAEAYYSTPGAQKIHQAISRGTAKMVEYINSRTSAAGEAELGKFLAHAKALRK